MSSAISHKRAQAQYPVLDLDFHRKINKMYEKLHAEGKLTTPTPSASQIFNLDEKRESINPGANAAFALGRNGNRAWHTITGERDPFQVSILYTACVDGKVGSLSPMVVHTGGTDELMPEHYARGLPSSCLVHSNESGCIDKDGFKAHAENSVRHCGTNAFNYVFLFIDAHESHFDSEAQFYLELHHAQVILL